MFEKITKIISGKSISGSMIIIILLTGVGLYGLGYGVGKFIFYFLLNNIIRGI